MLSIKLILMTQDKGLTAGAVRQFLEQLPEQALHVGVRAVLALVFYLIGLQVIRLIRNLVKRALQRMQADTGVIQFLNSFLKIMLNIILLFMIASGLGVDAASIAALLGTMGVAVGLAVQGSLSNFAGGVLIMLLRPFKVGDYIKEDTNGNEGTVIELNIFYTKLRTVDNQTVVLPNGSLANNSLTNLAVDSDRRLDMIIGISYETEIRTAKAVLLKVLEEEEAVMKDKEYRVYVSELAPGRVNIGVRCWFNAEAYWEGKWRITENIKYALDEAGIVLPQYQVIHQSIQ